MSAKRLTKADLDNLARVVNWVYCNTPITDDGWLILKDVADRLEIDHELRLRETANT